MKGAALAVLAAVGVGAVVLAVAMTAHAKPKEEGPGTLPPPQSLPPLPKQPAALPNLPWMPPSFAGVPVLEKSRDVSTTGFPVDVWSFPSPLINSATTKIEIASDDPSSWVAFSEIAGAQVRRVVLAHGPGVFTSQMEAQL